MKQFNIVLSDNNSLTIVAEEAITNDTFVEFMVEEVTSFWLHKDEVKMIQATAVDSSDA